MTMTNAEMNEMASEYAKIYMESGAFGQFLSPYESGISSGLKFSWNLLLQYPLVVVCAALSMIISDLIRERYFESSKYRGN